MDAGTVDYYGFRCSSDPQAALNSSVVSMNGNLMARAGRRHNSSAWATSKLARRAQPPPIYLEIPQ
jgi:hypothetical protein